MALYERLAPFLREYVYGEKWPSVRRVQEAAMREIFDGTSHVLIAAGTASGKTEAAFFPLLSMLADANTAARAGGPAAKPLVLYLGPLKALINDQYERLRKITAGAEEDLIPLWRWHGDVPADHKKKFIDSPGGVLLITPESLEALLLRHARKLGKIFAGLVFVVIDEVHAFMGSERGSQLLCQLARIEQEFGREPRGVRRAGLSATLGDYDGGRAWLSRGTGMPAVLVREEGEKRNLSLALDYFRADAPSKAPEDFYRALYRHCVNKRAIIFANSRPETEECAASLRRLAAAAGEPDVFYIHHGSVAARLRGEAEEKLKKSEGPLVAAATATLELGIDIGDLDRVIQIGPPWSVSAFVQRLGRSGRRNGRPEMYFTVLDAVSAGDELSAVPWDLVRTAAVVELYLGGRWIEPPVEKPFPCSLFAHELLALLGSGEHGAEVLKRRLFSLPPFASSQIREEDFTVLTRHFIRCAYIEKTEEGGLILAPGGEKIVNRHGFYSVFPGEESFRVLLEGRELGTTHFAAACGSVITVAGKAWRVEHVDGARREIRVTEADGSESDDETLWRGRGGEIHRKIAETVRDILRGGSGDPASAAAFSPAAREALERGRLAARKAGILDEVLCAAPRKTGDTFTRFVLAPWLGSSGMRTIAAFLKSNKKNLSLLSFRWNGFYFTLETALDRESFASVLKKNAAAARNAGAAALAGGSVPFADKYDYLLPQSLLAKQYAANILDIEALTKLY